MANNQTVLITGGTSGIGLEFSKLFHKDGYNLVIASFTQKKLEHLKSEFEAQAPNQKVEIIQTDLSTDGSAEKVFQECEARQLKVDVLVNNAGFGLYGEHTTLPANDMKRMLRLNIESLTLLCTLFGQKMKERQAGYIMNIASTASFQPLPYLAAYAASKSYVVNFSQALAGELSEFGITVCCYCPGSTETEFFKRSGLSGSQTGSTAIRFSMSPEEVARIGYKALFDKKFTSIPGFINQVVARANHFIPNRIIVAATSRFFKH